VGSDVTISVIAGDGIGQDITSAALAVVGTAMERCSTTRLVPQIVKAGAAYFQATGCDIEPGGEKAVGKTDAIFLGAIGLPSVRHDDGTEISPHLRLREMYQLYAGVRPVKAYPNATQRLSDPRAAEIDMVILRESTEGLFYSAAVHGRSDIRGDTEVRDTMRITRATTEKLHHFGFRLAQRRRERGKSGRVTCVDKANVFASMAFFRKIFDEVRADYPEIQANYNYVDAMALDLVRQPWDFDVMIMENMFGDILSDLAGGLVGGMGMASCAEIGDDTGLFQPAHGSAPDIMGQNKANPLAAILSGALMLDYLAEIAADTSLQDAADLINAAVDTGFAANRLRPMEFGGDMGTDEVTREVIALVKEERAA
jgi:3-isopropylmalate dehydrogenase